jgi:hypothetical protein
MKEILLTDKDKQGCKVKEWKTVWVFRQMEPESKQVLLYFVSGQNTLQTKISQKGQCLSIDKRNNPSR